MSASYNPLLHKKVTLTSSAIKSLNTTPQKLIDAPRSGEAIEVISAVGQIRFNSSAYATNTEMQILASGASTHQLSNVDLLAASSDQIEKFDPNEGGILLAKTQINITVAAGDPTSGDSPVDIFLSYRVIYDL